jgi:putative SOS response-associated peptidase YedK
LLAASLALSGHQLEARAAMGRFSRLAAQKPLHWKMDSPADAPTYLTYRERLYEGVGGELVNFGVNRRYGAVLRRLAGVTIFNSCAICSSWRSICTRNPLPNYPARFNIAPTDPVLTVRFNPKTTERTLDALRWGLLPHWVKDLKDGSRMINARAETLATQPAFRDAFKARRCIIPASGFYEWQKIGAVKQPHAIVPEADPIFAFAGLWENWRDRAAGESAEWIRTWAIIAGEPNELVAPIHNRMPVILPRETWSA